MLGVGGVVSIFNIVLVKILVHFGMIADSGRGATFKISKILCNIKGVLDYQVSFWKIADGILMP